MTAAHYLAIEGGGTGTRVVCADADGHTLARAGGSPASALYADPEAYPRELVALIRSVVPDGDVPLRAGLAGPVNRAQITDAIRQVFPQIPVHAYSEGEIALAVYDLRWGVSIVAGTGSSARAASTAGEWVEVGGFGPQFDDLGSAYWLAREAMAAVLRAEHGRGPSTALRAAMFEHFSLASPWDLVSQCVGNGHLAVARVAGFARAVTDLANAGDAVAVGLCEEAAAHLADLVQAAARRAQLGGESGRMPVPVVPTGGLWGAGDVLFTPFCAALADATTAYEVLLPVPDPMQGLLNLLRRA